MNEILKYEGREVRMVMKNGEPWWVAKDVCDILEHSNSRKVLERLDDDEKGVTSVYTPGGMQEMAVVNESGLYVLILSSRKSEAKKFKRWVTHEVIPELRKNGNYSLVPAAPKTGMEKINAIYQMLDVIRDHQTQLIEHEGRIESLDTSVAVLESRVDLFGSDTGYCTILCYGKKHNLKMPESKARAVGKKAASLCNERGVAIGKVDTERWGKVNSYPDEVITEALLFVNTKQS